MIIRYPSALIKIIEILFELIAPTSSSSHEIAKSPNPSATYNAKVYFISLKTHKPKITIITPKIKFIKVVGSTAIKNTPPLMLIMQSYEIISLFNYFIKSHNLSICL